MTLKEMIKLAEDAGFAISLDYYPQSDWSACVSRITGPPFYTAGNKDLPTAFREALRAAGVLENGK